MRRRFVITTLLMAAAAWPVAARAQSWALGVDAGRIRSTIDPIARQTQSLVANIGFEDAASAFRLSAGIPTPDDSVRWAAIAALRRFSTTHGGLTTGIDLTGSAFAFELEQSVPRPPSGLLDPLGSAAAPPSATTVSGRAVAAQAMPVIGYERGWLQLQARAGMSYSDAPMRPETKARAVRLGDLQLAVVPSPAFSLAMMAQHYVPRHEDASTFVGTSGAGVIGKLRVFGSVGTWISGVPAGEHGAAAWSMGGELRLTQRARLEATTRHDGFDPLHLSPAQTSWSVGASVLLGRSRTPPAAPVPADYENGTATIRVPASLFSSPPRVAGDFNGWKPAPMERAGASWSYSVVTAPGVYNYAFVAPDGTWYVPDGVPGRKDDGMGGQVAVLVIR